MFKNLRSLWMVGLGFGILFTLLAAGQYAFLRHQLDGETTQELLNGADEMRDDILSAEPWNLQGYRNSTSGPDTYVVIAANGTLIDAHGFDSKMLPSAFVPFPQNVDQIVKYTSDVKENWNLYTHKLTDGFLILGVLDEDAPAHLDERFAETSARFGSSVATALATSERKVPQSFDYTIVDQSGGLKYVAGGIPLKASPPGVPAAPYAKWFAGSDGSSIWASVINPVINKRGEPLAVIRDFQDVTDRQAMLHRAGVFNLFAGGILWLATMLIGAAYLRRIAPEPVSCSRIPTLNESETVEFKSSFRWDYATLKKSNELENAVIKTVAGFLNSERGGTLIIGVSDKREILGLEADYAVLHSRKDRDGFEQTLSQALMKSVGGANFARCVRIDFCTTAGKEICLVRVAPARRPIFVEEKGAQTMYVRTGNSTRPLNTPDAVAYATEHFGGLWFGWRNRRSRVLPA
jgi:hypothetical protein